jgi:hypothetical protein
MTQEEIRPGPAMKRFTTVSLVTAVPVMLLAVVLAYFLEVWLVVLIMLAVVLLVDLPLAVAAVRESNRSADIPLEQFSQPARAVGTGKPRNTSSSKSYWRWAWVAAAYTTTVLVLWIWLKMPWVAAALAIAALLAVAVLMASFRRGIAQVEAAESEGIQVDGVIARTVMQVEGSEREVRDLIIDTVDKLPRFKLLKSDDSSLTIRGRANFWSFGQFVLIRIQPQGNYCSLALASWPSVITAANDWGQSAKDLAALSKALLETGRVMGNE